LDTTFQIGPWLISPKLNRIARNGKTIHLEPKIMSVLVCLAEHQCNVVSKEQLFAAVWADTFVTDDVLKRSISELRKALEDDPKEPEFIETIPKGGYRLVISTTPVVSQAHASRRPFSVAFHHIALVGGVVLLGGVIAVWFRWPTPTPKAFGYTQLTTDGLEKTPPLLTDGSRVYFTVTAPTGRLIGQVSTSGGQTVPVPTPFRVVRATDVSPRGSELLVGNFFGQEKAAPVFVLPLPGGSPRRLSNLMSRGDMAWSPDGKQIAYMKGADLWMDKSDGTEVGKLATLPGVPFYRELHWSPNRKVLRFWLDDGKRVTLWEISSNGTHLHRLLEGWDRELRMCCANWTADGKYFIFQSCPTDGGPVRIWAIREDAELLKWTSSQPMLLAETPMNIVGTVPSRDGKKLFLNSYIDRMELVRYSATSGKFVPYLPGISGLGASFSRDGQWVTYMSWPDGLLWRNRLDGSQRLQLSSFGVDGASWSPDGKQIAFAGADGAWWTSHIFVTSADGGSPQQLTTGDRSETWPDWSPDGNLLVFGSETKTEAAIHIFDLRTHQVSTVRGSQGLTYARWSPDGRYIAASGNADGEKKLSLFDSRTQKWVELAKGQLTWPTWPTWSRDGRYVYVRDTIEGEAYLERVRISDHTLEKITSLNDLKQRQSRFDGTWIGLAPDGSTLALRDLSSGEIFALDLQLP
jgi:DNA-binding winged helix-turn-helix (wHTH) protein/Tol biopolymer transport system component